MLKIGDFSSLSQVPIKTLRYYDEMGLFGPEYVDSLSGYRYYSVTQMPRLHRILALKDLGFSLEQIGRLLKEHLSAEQLRGMYLLRETEQQERVEEEQARLSRLRARLSLIDKEQTMINDVVIKEVPEQWIASVRATIPNYPSVGPLYGQVMQELHGSCAGGLPVALWHDPEYKDHDVDAEAGFYLKQPLPTQGKVKIYQLPAVKVASAVHNGAYNRLSEAYDSLLRWVGSNGYQVAGPLRELYLKCSQPVRQDDESYVTEIQVPVQAA
jgi:effector-binding domain-containing protein